MNQAAFRSVHHSELRSCVKVEVAVSVNKKHYWTWTLSAFQRITSDVGSRPVSLIPVVRTLRPGMGCVCLRCGSEWHGFRRRKPRVTVDFCGVDSTSCGAGHLLFASCSLLSRRNFLGQFRYLCLEGLVAGTSVLHTSNVCLHGKQTCHCCWLFCSMSSDQ